MIHPRNMKRFREITAILIRHGFGWLIVELGLGRLVPFHWGLLGHPRRKQVYSAAEHLRMAFEELGPTFIKLAQILSTRPDLVSPTYAEEFARLQDRVPPMPFTAIQPVLEMELGQSYTAVFAELDTRPLASASIGQVYRARLKDGQSVVVKIQKPGLRDIIQRDMDILKEVVQYMSIHTRFGQKYDLGGLLEEFRFTLENELDYVREGQNADRFRALFKKDHRLRIPKIYWEWSTSRVLVMEEIQGIKVTELDHYPEGRDINRQKLAEIAVSLTFKEIFEFGFYHADPHPGNFVVMDDQRLGLMDFGLVGYLEDQTREHFLRFSYAMTTGDVEGMIDAMWAMGITGPFETRPALKRDLNHLLFRVKDRSLQELAASDLIHDLMAIAYRHQLHFPPDLALLFKVLAMSEGLGAMIDPQFKLFDFARPYLRRLMRKLFAPERVTKKALGDAMDLLILTHGLPRRVSYLLQRIENGDIQVHTTQPEMERMAGQMIAAMNRLTTSILTTLILIALGIYILAGHFMGFDNYLVNILLGLFGFGGLVAVRILWGIWKQRRSISSMG